MATSVALASCEVFTVGGDKERRVLVVDDEASIVDLVTMALSLLGMTTRGAKSGKEALSMVESFYPHLVVLDVMLPDMDGYEVMRRMSESWRSASIPVLLLTARRGLDDRISGLKSGATDYVVKPFSVEELTLRVQGILRRTVGDGPDGSSVSVGDLILDTDTQEARRRGVLLDLTPTEFKLLRFLMINAGQVVTRSQIRDRVWEHSQDDVFNQIAVYISYLRKKIDALGPSMIRTVRGIGYSLRAPVNDSNGASESTS
nr:MULTISPECIES: response regulator transcription factor [Acidithrix]